MNFPWVEVKKHILQHLDTGKGFCDVLHPEEAFFVLWVHHREI